MLYSALNLHYLCQQINDKRAIMTSRYILTLLLVLLLCSCNRRPAPLHPALQRAEQLMQKHPDSALAVLSHYNSRSFSDSADMAAYALLRTKAEDKNYIDHTNDSLIRIAVRYYDRRGSDFQKAESHYYWGRIFQDKGNDVRTAEQFINALSQAEKSKDNDLIYLIKGNLAYILWTNELPNEAEIYYKELIEWYKQQGDKQRLAATYLNLGEIYLYSSRYASNAIHYLLAGLMLIDQSENRIIANDLLSALSNSYEINHQYIKAIQYAKRGINNASDSTDMARFYLVAGKSYMMLGRKDSAFVYLRFSLKSHNPSILNEAYLKLSQLSSQKGLSKDALNYLNKSVFFEKQIIKSTHSSSVVKTIKDMLHRQRLNDYKSSWIKFLLYLSVPLLLCFAIGVYFLRKRHKRNLLQMESIESELKLEREKVEFIEEQRDRDIKRKQNYEEKAPLIIKFKNHPIYNKIVSSIDHNNQTLNPSEKITLTDEEWKEFQNIVNDIFPGFIEQLESPRYLLTSQDVSFCCLVRLEFNYSEIAGIFGCSPQAVSKRKKRLFNQFDVESTTAFERKLKNI